MSRPIRIAVASGKGGTGKTTVATSLAVALAEAGRPVAYLDCDVEEPNGHIFLKPTIRECWEVESLVPEIDEASCTLCAACSQACRYAAIAVLPTGVVTYPKLCHGCGGCRLACAAGAIREVTRVTGVVETGTSGPLAFLRGVLNVGEPMAPPVIRAVLQRAPTDCTLVLDAPPGTSCAVIESVKTADVVLLVAEPTPFGLNDLKLAVEMTRALGLPPAVVVNRAGVGDTAIHDFCAHERIPILLEIPDDREIVCAYSRGELATTPCPWLKPKLVDLYDRLDELARAVRVQSPRRRAQVAPASSERNTYPSEAVSIGRSRDVRELVVVSGKGGTGKTSLVASFAALAQQVAVADCDVDAADLHLVLSPTVLHQWPVADGRMAVIDAERCDDCGQCLEVCRFDAVRSIHATSGPAFNIDPVACEGCGVCVDACSRKAVSLVATVNGEWFISSTRHGPMAHARLGVAQENSGKLVSLLRREAQALARTKRLPLVLCDGAPGVGCPVIASIAGAHMVLVVTEPTLSGMHDLKRVTELCDQFRIRVGVCINKADINPEVSDQIEAYAAHKGMLLLGRVRYDESVTAAQLKQMAVVECGDAPAACDIRAVWERVQEAVA